MAGRTFINGKEIIVAGSISMLTGTNETSPLLAIKQTPTSASTNTIMSIAAGGSSWSGGYCLELTSADPTLLPLAIGVTPGSPNATISRGGEINVTSNVKVGGNFQLTGGGSVVSTANGDILIAPHGTGKLGVFGAAGLTQQAHIVDADGSLADITTKFNALLAYMEGFGWWAAS